MWKLTCWWEPVFSHYLVYDKSDFLHNSHWYFLCLRCPHLVCLSLTHKHCIFFSDPFSLIFCQAIVNYLYECFHYSLYFNIHSPLFLSSSSHWLYLFAPSYTLSCIVSLMVKWNHFYFKITFFFFKSAPPQALFSNV